MCVFCTVAAWGGGAIGSYFGISPPEQKEGKILSALITANLTAITVIALKVLFNVSPCRGGQLTLANLARVGGQMLIIGVIYAIGVNYLLNRYVFPKQPSVPACCQGK
jgi:hypothetical protein